VRLFDGRLKLNQGAHAAVVEIDVGRRDLQQCADAVIRLRAEHLFGAGLLSQIRFRFTSGAEAVFSRWAAGERPVVEGRTVRWIQSARPDASHGSLRLYLDKVFGYAGTYSLAKELVAVERGAGIEAGDVFIRGGFPGHAVLVVDVAEEARTGRRVFLIVQSYMPAQSIHLLKNPTDATLSPWYLRAEGSDLVTPEWTFRPGELRRFPRRPVGYRGGLAAPAPR
jgi:hypothetical protein